MTDDEFIHWYGTRIKRRVKRIMEGDYLPPLEPEYIAVICHAANKAYSEILGEPADSWDSLNEERQAGVIEGVISARDGMTPKWLHENWCKNMKAQGYVYGEKKDTGKKTHPRLVPYEALPASQRKKDALFLAIVKVMLAEE